MLAASVTRLAPNIPCCFRLRVMCQNTGVAKRKAWQFSAILGNDRVSSSACNVLICGCMSARTYTNACTNRAQMTT